MDAKTKSNILQLNDEMHKELEDHLIPFWLKLKDIEHGGFYGLIDYDLVLDKNAVKGFIDLGTQLLKIVNDLGTAFGHLPTILGTIGGIAT